jgi:hypothetical protein
MSRSGNKQEFGIGVKQIKVGKTVGNTDENHEESFAVHAGHKNGTGGERGIRTPLAAP